jgi:hypothetical protein
MLLAKAKGVAVWGLYSRFEAFIWTWLIKPILALIVARYIYAFIRWIFDVDPGLWLAMSLPGPTSHGLIEFGRWTVIGAPALLLLFSYEARRTSQLYADYRNSLLYETRPMPRMRVAVRPKPPVVPDRSITDLFRYIHPAPFQTFLDKEKVGQQVIEKFASGTMKTWGREIVAGQRKPLAEIPKDAWRSSRFTYWFLDGGEGSREICHVECDGPERSGAPRLYCDLQVNRGQLESVWPGSVRR